MAVADHALLITFMCLSEYFFSADPLVALSFIVNRPAHDPGFRLSRQEAHDRVVRYTVQSYATDRPQGEGFTD